MKQARWHSCNIVETKPETRRLWEFGADNGEVKPDKDRQVPVGQKLPQEAVRKDWRSLWQPKLNVAWLPESSVFLRVIDIPVATEAETVSMVELQLEKLSPIPVAQVVWSFEVLPKAGAQGGSEGGGELQKVIVIIAARSVVEGYLGKLEADGFLADRLELPLLHQFLSVKTPADGAYIHLKPGHATTLCLIGWWLNKSLKNLTLCHLPTGEGGIETLTRILTQSAWAGEIEGWVSAAPHWYLVADTETSAFWAAKLGQRLGERVAVVDAPSESQLAALTARHALAANGKVSLLPADFSNRYRQQFIDGLWMKSVFVVLALYVIGLVIYFGAVQVLRFKQYQIQSQVRELTPGHTNALQLQARLQVLQEQANLKFAALDCWKAVAELLPTELTLTKFALSSGKTLQITGYTQGDQDHVGKISDYNQALRVATNNVGTLFSQVSSPNVNTVPGPAGPQTAMWVFNCELNSAEP